MPSPVISACIVCDDVRFEKRNVVSIIGSYGPLPDALIYLVNVELEARLCFAFYGKPISGTFTFRAELRGPDGKLPTDPMPRQIQMTIVREKGLFFVAFWFPNVVFRKAGDYTLALRSNGQECYAETFRIVQATPELRASFLA